MNMHIHNSSSERVYKKLVGFSPRRSLSIITILGIANTFFSLAHAHNKVVVIPMIADKPELKPFALIPMDDTRSTDYISTNGISLDKVTGLEWQQIDTDTVYTFNNAKEYCRELNLGGKSDWRLPTVKELFSIVDSGKAMPAINQTAFPETDSEAYWGSTLSLNLGERLFGVHFSIGSFASLTPTNSHLVRCVRSTGRNALASLLVDNGNGTVTDMASGLIWQQQDDGTPRVQAGAISYCQGLALAGSGDWRLPGIKELLSIVDFRGLDPAIDTQIFPSTESRYWSASTNVINTEHAWLVSFILGIASTRSKENNSTYARCVRNK